MMLAAVITTALVISLLACGVYRRAALRWRILDIPNERSSHTVPTPRGGGIGVLLGLGAGWSLALLFMPWSPLYSYLLTASVFLMLIGVIDDRIGLPVILRFLIYGVACFFTVWVLLWPLPLWAFMLFGLYALWLLNLFNFMDGIDGIAAAEVLFVGSAASLLSALGQADVEFMTFNLMLVAACAGFLAWNWAPARLFMGDTGSIPLGFLLAALSLSGVIPLYCWLILLAAFIGDASITLLWRAATGQQVTRAHRLHIYQRLSRHWNSHARVVWAMTAYNLLWLAPLAILSLFWPDWLPASLLLAYLPLLFLWFKAVKLP